MPYDTTELSNMALGHIGIGLSIGDLDNESSAEAIACRRYFTHCRDVIYRMRRWPFASRVVSLSDLGVSGTNYEGTWLFRYSYPNFCVRANKIVNPAMRAETTAEDKIIFEVASKDDTGSAGKVILSDQCDALLDYNHLIEDVSVWDAEFAESFTTYLAVRIAPSLKADAGLTNEAREQWALFLKNSMNTADSEAQPDPERISQFHAVRG